MSVDVRTALRDAIRLLEVAGVPTPQVDASALLDAAAGRKSAAIDQVPDDVADNFRRMIARRARREPVSHITGRRAFWMHEFKVTKDVLDPRPDTETLVEYALSLPFNRVLDLGTGSGCIIISLLAERASATGLSVDMSSAALDIARENAEHIGVSDRLALTQSNWFERVSGQFDLIVSNPPYIPDQVFEGLEPEVRRFEPKMALTAGKDGLDAYRVISAQAKRFLTKGGRLVVEIGYDQRAAVTELFLNEEYEDVTCHRDLAGKDRVISGKWG